MHEVVYKNGTRHEIAILTFSNSCNSKYAIRYVGSSGFTYTELVHAMGYAWTKPGYSLLRGYQNAWVTMGHGTE